MGWRLDLPDSGPSGRFPLDPIYRIHRPRDELGARVVPSAPSAGVVIYWRRDARQTIPSTGFVNFGLEHDSQQNWIG
jgi:hypothetical protein